MLKFTPRNRPSPSETTCHVWSRERNEISFRELLTYWYYWG